VARPTAPDDYRSAQKRAELSLDDLWLHYFTLGGGASSLEIEAFLGHLHEIGDYQQDILAHALNESLLDLGSEELVGYCFEGH
jgi:hypothetical protein